ncbi:hypothetical protein Athai_52490 [Actinocatenispora thailandica]|uniref:Uncharacterized protein n=1 Tax=Actinocatenispora thailandica TaxID=227318 RepID=A0A7R7HZP5_9ACTN|nr:hypothetical protein [Actinocatenispora thailandica]BCJ37746.1 hypothetical protein Athai_52490 [Actinocatenispora thailandica]
MNEQSPVRWHTAIGATARCLLVSAGLLVRGRIRQPADAVGRRIRFANGTSARVYRETRLAGATGDGPCTLVVAFRVRLLRGRWHALFRAVSVLNTPLFVGYPGFVGKLWLAADERGDYRGVYDWDGWQRAESYARSLWRVLQLISVPGSIRYEVIPGVRRDEAMADPALLVRLGSVDGTAWWRLVGTS